MTTAAERLVAVSGLSGVAASVMLAAIGPGGTTGAALVAYSGLATGTAAEHLLTDRAATLTAGGSVRRRPRRPAEPEFQPFIVNPMRPPDDDDVLVLALLN